MIDCSLSGKKTASSSSPASVPEETPKLPSKGILTPDDGLDMFGGGRSSSPARTEIGDDFEEDVKSLLGNINLRSLMKEATTVPEPPPVDAGRAGAPAKGPALTLAEAQELQRRIDAMSDEQIELVFERMRGAISGMHTLH